MTTAIMRAADRAAIDMHTHITPASIPDRHTFDGRWPSIKSVNDGDSAMLAIGGKPFRSLDARSWDASVRLGDMSEQGIAMQLLSPMPELLSFWLPALDATYLASHVNEYIAAMIAKAPTSFAGLGMIPAQDTSEAVRQLKEVKRLGLHGVEIGTHINGIPLGDRSLWPIYEAAEAMGLSLFIHPLHPCGIDRIGGAPEVAAVAIFPLEIAMAAVSLMSAGVQKRFPGLRMMLSHGGGALASILGRLDRGRACSPPVRAALSDDARTSARHFWFDSNVYDATTLRFLTERVGSDRIVVGSDYPFALQQDRPAEFVEQALPGLALQCACNARAFLDRGA